MPISAVAKLAITAGLMGVQYALGASRKIEGPRLDELDVTTADYGTPIPRFWGKRRFEVPIMWTEKLREKKKTSKTKGGKYAEYRYFGTWAVAIADHEIDAVTRIWMDRRLVFQTVAPGPTSIAYMLGLDGSGVTPIIEGNLGDMKLTRGKNMRIYLGTDTQDPDPRMEAWCEDRYGANTCPAYRNVAYIVFQDIPLEKFGNRIPQISVEAISAKSDAYPVEEKATGFAMSGFSFSSNFSRFAQTVSADEGQAYEIWDTATRTRLISNTFPVSMGQPLGVSDSGIIYGISGGLSDPYLQSVSADGFGDRGGAKPCQEAASHPVCIGEQVYVCPFGNIQPWIMIPDADEVIAIAADFSPTDYIEDLDGNHWAVGRAQGTTTCGLECVYGPRAGDGGTFISPSGSTASCYGVYNGTEFVLGQAANIFKVDPETFTVTDDADIITNPSAVEWQSLRPGSTSLWAGHREISLQTLTEIRAIDVTDWGIAGYAETVYDPISHALIVKKAADTDSLYWLYLDRAASNGVALSTIVDDVAGWCGLTDADTADLDQIVQGYSVTQGTGKDMIAPLLDIHDSIARPHDFTAQFIKRGDAASGTLLTEDFVREGDEARYTITITQDTDLPRRISLNYADVGNDQQTNTVESRRPLDAVDSVREVSLDMTTYVSSPDEAQQLTDRFLRRQWIRAEGHTLGLTAQELALEPGDVRNLNLDGIIRTAMCVKTTLTGGAIQTEWERDFPSLTTLGDGTGAVMDGRDPDEIIIVTQSKGFVLDIPLITDSDNSVNPLLYYGAGKYITASAWPGAVVYVADLDGEDYMAWQDVDSSQGATWGYAKTALADADPWLWDRGNTVNVDVRGGTLTTVTEAAIDADPELNLAYLGGELLNFTTVNLEGDGTYTLSGFKRGRRGTEWAVPTHAVGDEFILAENLLKEGVGLSEVGTSDSYKAATLGREPDGSPVIEVDFTGATLKPYAPARVKWTSDGTDMFGEIIRRTRVGGAWTGGSTIPLSENSEAYEVDIMDGDDVLRTIDVTGTNTFTYTAAMMSADGNTLAAPPDANVYQLSDAVGRGFALAA
jgi:hypothetical protein